jgi:hypothetical protein
MTRNPNSNATDAPGNSGDAADLRLQQNVAAIHQLGLRALYELLIELAAVTGQRATVESVVARYAGIDQAHLYVTRGDRFAPRPLLLVRRDP